jgi:hypothetical protein
VSVLSPVQFVPHVPESPIFATIYANYQEQTATGSFSTSDMASVFRITIDENPPFTNAGRGLWVPNGYAVTMLMEYWGATGRIRAGTAPWLDFTKVLLKQVTMRASKDGGAEQDYAVLVATDSPAIYTNFRFRLVWEVEETTSGNLSGSLTYELTRRVALRLFMHPLFIAPTFTHVTGVRVPFGSATGRTPEGGGVAEGGGSGANEGGSPPGDPIGGIGFGGGGGSFM